MVDRDSSVYHTSGIVRWVPPGDPAIDGRREEGHKGIPATAIFGSPSSEARTIAAPPKPTHPTPTFSSIDAAPKTSKGWGDEVEIVNLDYCGKLLRFRKGAKLSMHSHAQKAESFLISSGRISFGYIDTSNAHWSTHIMNEGDIVHIPRMLPHQIEALEDTIVTEFSTHHEDADSYRVFPGNSQLP